MRLLLTLGILLTVGSGACGQTSIFGIALGTPLAQQAPRCNKTIYGLTDEAICWVPSFSSDPAMLSYDVGLRDSEKPVGVRQLTAVEIDGRVQSVIVSTFGDAYQEAFVRELTKKFGKPSRLSRTPMTNALGARYVRVNAQWRRADVSVDLFGFESDVSWGRLIVGTREYMDREARNESNREATRRKL